MDTTQAFSLTRLGLLLKRDLLQHAKKNLFTLLSLYLTSLLIMLFSTLTSPGTFEAAVGGSAFLFAFVMNIWASVYASSIMNVMNTKEKRISFLMLPATNIEKFLSRALWVCVGFFVMATVAVVAAEFTRYLLCFMIPALENCRHLAFAYLFTHENIGELFRGFNDAMRSAPIDLSLFGVLLALQLFWGYSLYILGGSIWYRHPFLKTTACLLVFSYVIAPVLSLLGMFGVLHIDANTLNHWMQNISFDDINAIVSIGSVVSIVLIVLTWWLSYHLFTRAQVVRKR